MKPSKIQASDISMASAAKLSVTGPAFPLVTRVLVMLLGLATALIAVPQAPAVLSASPWSHLVLLASLVAFMLWYGWHLLTSKTLVANGMLKQVWLSDKEARIDDIVKARFLGLPYLSVLMGSRLSARLSDGTWVIFHGGTAALGAAFAHIEIAIKGRATDAH
jgi:hypothetical protein